MTDPRPKILLIDDMPVNLLTLGAALAPDFDLQTATSGAMGLALASQAVPDLILLDVMMPEMDGFETCRRLKADPLLKAIPVVFVTALSDLDAEVTGLALGAADYLTKPVNMEIARHRIRNLVERERLRKKVERQQSLLEAKILELGQVESALQASNLYKHVILNSIMAEIAVVDRNGIIQEVNEPWRRFALENRVTPNEPVRHVEVGSNYFAVFETADFTSPEISAAFKGIKGVISGTLAHFKIEYPCHSPTQQRWFSMSVSPLDKGAIMGAVITHTNITERKVAQAQLIDSEARLRTIVQNEPECIKIVNAQGLLVQMNPAGLVMIEADTFEQVAGQPVLNLIAPDYRQAFAAMHQRVLNGESMAMKFEVIGLKGGRRWLETHAVPMQDHGTAVQLAITRDITESRQDQEKLHLAASVFTYSREGIMITSPQGTIIDVNDAFSHITGYNRDEVVGQSPRLLSSHHQGKEFYTNMWSELIQAGHWCGEVWNRRKNGEVYVELQTISAVRDAQGNTQQYVALFSDITQRKQMENHVRQLAFYDPLTKVPNRRLLSDRLNQTMAASKRSGCYGALMFLDLDNFKPLNDTHGHEVGDLLLTEVAQRLKNSMREVDTVARFGGDEFVVIINDLDTDRTESATQAGLIAEKIRLALAQPYLLVIQREGKADITVEHRCTVTIGVTVFIGNEASQSDILKWADAAMYQAKEAGRNGVKFFSPDQ